MGFTSGSDGKESTCNAGDLGSISGSGRSPGEGDGNSHQYSCLENSMDRGAWRAAVHGVAKSGTRLRDSHFHFVSEASVRGSTGRAELTLLELLLRRENSGNEEA